MKKDNLNIPNEKGHGSESYDANTEINSSDIKPSKLNTVQKEAEIASENVRKVGIQRVLSTNDISSSIQNDVSSEIYSMESVEAELTNKSKQDCSFADIVQKAKDAIKKGIKPKKIPSGSSGSYFLRDEQKKYIAIFKPRDEEPFGSLNPKWMKWFQKLFCPCLFGRKCLLRNQGYLSEAGAYLVDQKLGLSVVPETRVEAFACKTFHYSKVTKNSTNRIYGDTFVSLPNKFGSMQLFIDNCKDAKHWLDKPEFMSLEDSVKQQFQEQFERLVILDYIIRNTDRTPENWLIRCEKENIQKKNGVYSKRFKIVKVDIFAIDNGLAFPFKHPDSLRVFPFPWAKLPYAKIPFSQATIHAILPLVSNDSFIQELCQDLLDLFKLDKNFDVILYEKQMSVLRGQILNVQDALSKGKTPKELAEMCHLEKLKNRGYVGNVSTESRNIKDFKVKYVKKPKYSC